MLVPPPGDERRLLRRPDGLAGPAPARQAASPAAACCMLDAAPVYTRIVERMRWLPETDDDEAAGRTICRRASSGCC